MIVRMVQRREDAILPPFEGYRVRPGDVLVVVASRQALTEALKRDPGLLHPDLRDGGAAHGEDGQPWDESDRVLAEAMVAPGSRLAGLTLPQIGFRYKTSCIVLGIQRRSRMIRSRITDIRLEAGDVLLVQGQPDDVAALRRNRDVVLIEWSARELPAVHHARTAVAIFVAVMGAAAAGLVPVVVAALSGAAAMVGGNVLTVRQAIRAVDGAVALLPADGGAVEPDQHQNHGRPVHANRRRHRP